MVLVRSDAPTAQPQIRKTTRCPKSPKRARGRPPIYRPEFAEQVTSYCLLGATNAELGKVFGVDERTINRWLVTKPEFCQAVKDGREVADANVAQSLYRKALSGDVAACFIWLKNRQPHRWRDKKEVDSTQPYAAQPRSPTSSRPRLAPCSTKPSPSSAKRPTSRPASPKARGKTNGATKH